MWRLRIVRLNFAGQALGAGTVTAIILRFNHGAQPIDWNASSSGDGNLSLERGSARYEEAPRFSALNCSSVRNGTLNSRATLEVSVTSRS